MKLDSNVIISPSGYSMKENKKHWYDGWFYDKFIAPHQDYLFSQVINLIEPESKVIDVGCGTGRFSFLIAGKCKSILGIDLSIKNIDRANRNLLLNPDKSITFQHTTLNLLMSMKKEHFNYAVSTFVIHEIDEEERVKLLLEMSEIADKIIIADYLYPYKTVFLKVLNKAVEFAAGKDHYSNYKNFMKNGGIRELASQAGLKIIYEIKNQPPTSHIVMLSK